MDDDAADNLTKRLGPSPAEEDEEPSKPASSSSIGTIEPSRSQDRQVTRASAAQPVPAEPTDLLPKGTAVGRFVILDVLGEGGMSIVYRAFDPELDRHIALKFLSVSRSRGGTGAQQRARLVREAQALAKISHPNIVAVYDVGMFQKKVFVAMELVQGKNVRQWLRDAKRSQQDIVRVFYEAGCGLAAAHRAGVIHRDFKPDNVIVGNDSRVRVLDFGLARGSETAAPEPFLEDSLTSPSTTDSAMLFIPITMAGSIMGTPAYMAPEQHLGGAVTERTDQFAFCVSLYEALSGARPFKGRNSEELRDQVLRGGIEEIIPKGNLPQRLRRLVLRGMSLSPDHRFPSMDALLVDLNKIAGAKRRWAIAGLSAAVALCVILFGLLRFGGQIQPCLGAERQLRDVWNEEVAAGVQRLFLQTNLPFAAKASEEVSRRLSQYAERWAVTHRDVCEATRVHGDQSEEVMDLRMACLAQRREELRTLVEIFTHADAAVVQRAVEATAALTRLEVCDDVQALKSRVPPPSDPQTRQAVDQLRSRLSAIKALGDAGKYKEGLEQSQAVSAEAQRLAYLPIRAEALYRLAQFQYKRGKLDRALKTLDEAAWTAEAGGHDEALANCLQEQVRLTLEREDFKASQRLGRRADAVILRLRDPAELRGGLQIDLARLAGLQAHYPEAARFSKAAVETLERALGLEHPGVARAYQVLGSALAALGQIDEATATVKKALAMLERIHGPEHPTVASALLVLGNLYADEGQYDEFERLMRRALEIWERAEGPDHPDVGQVLVNIGAALQSQRRFDEALPFFERAMAIFKKAYGAEHSTVATVLQNLAEIALNTRQVERARTLYEQALTIDERTYGPDHPYLAYDLLGLGDAYLALSKPGPAQAFLERALALPGQDRALVSGIRFSLARALWERGQRPRARELAQQARAFFAERADTHLKELGEIDAWLSQRTPQ